MEKPKIVSGAEWQQARDDLLRAEKEATRTLDAIAARRRRLPMVSFGNDYTFDTTAGKRTLLDLFDDQVQLAVYQFMDRGPDEYCPGCTWFTNNVAQPAGAGQLRCRLGDSVRHAARADRGVQIADGVDVALRVLARYVVRPGLRRR